MIYHGVGLLHCLFFGGGQCESLRPEDRQKVKTPTSFLYLVFTPNEGAYRHSFISRWVKKDRQGSFAGDVFCFY